MPYPISREKLTAAALAAIVLTAGCQQHDDSEPEEGVAEEAVGAAIALPIEVMPTDPAQFHPDPVSGPFFFEKRQFTIDAAGAQALFTTGGKLFIQGHGLGYRDGHMDINGVLQKDGKGSVWIGPLPDIAHPNDYDPACPWIDLKNNQPGLSFSHPTPGGIVPYPEAVYDKIGGGFRTVRFTIDLTKFVRPGGTSCLSATATNVIRFRFNGTDGTSSGYRILDFNLLDGSGTRRILEGFSQDDPSLWTDPAGHDTEAARSHGQTLFGTRGILRKDPALPALMTAACSDCHAWDGRDLEYFSYSNNSIVNRAIFHGLSADDGKDIAAYIRHHAVSRLGRPWNPPYQPGAAIHDEDPTWDVAKWAAGAGLEAVLDDEHQDNDLMLRQIFGTTAAAPVPTEAQIRATIEGTGLPQTTINMRRIPIGIELPDWNSWLPEVHPLDLWGSDYWNGNWNGHGDFDTQVTYGVGDNPLGVTSKDLNGDGIADFVAANTFSNTVSVYLGVQDGSILHFTGPINSPAGSGPRSIAVGYFDNDTKLDLAVADNGSSSVSILIGNGAGGFTLTSTVTVGNLPEAIVATDYDRDGKMDLAVACGGNSRVYILRGNGLGSFTQLTNVQVGLYPTALAVGYFDNNLYPDFVTANRAANTASVLLWTGSGAMTVSTLNVGTYPQGVAVGDLDGDNRLDIAVTNSNSNNLSLYMGTGAGGFTQHASSPIAVGTFPVGVAAARIAASDTRDSIAVANQLSNEVSVIALKPTGGFSAQTFGAGNEPRALAFGDFDENGLPDLAVANRASDDVSVMIPAAVNVAATYTDLRARLYAHVGSMPYPELEGDLQRLNRASQQFVGTGMYPVSGGLSDGYRGDRGLVIDHAVLRGYNHELVKRDLIHWVGVKYWELMQEFGIETLGDEMYGIADGEKLSWPTGGEQTVHPAAPHITAVNSNNFQTYSGWSSPVFDACAPYENIPSHPCYNQLHAAQTPLKGDYDSTAWYHLQMVLFSGARSRTHDLPASPVDVGYAYGHVDDLSRRTNRWESIRYLATMIKVYQMRDNDKGPEQTGWSMRDVSPRLLVSNQDGLADDDDLFEHLGTLRAPATNALLDAFLDIVEGSDDFSYANWPRCGPASYTPVAPTPADAQSACANSSAVRVTWPRISPANYTVSVTQSMINHFNAGGVSLPNGAVQHVDTNDPEEFPSDFFDHADHIYRAIPYLVEAGADPVQICRLVHIGETLWPGPSTAPNNWAAWKTWSPYLTCP